MRQLDQPIDDPVFQKMFDIPAEFYAQSYFLRNIKEAYIRFGSLSEKQVEAFKRTVEEMKNPKPPVEETADIKVVDGKNELEVVESSKKKPTEKKSQRQPKVRGAGV